jgi:hypothetical protein
LRNTQKCEKRRSAAIREAFRCHSASYAGIAVRVRKPFFHKKWTQNYQATVMGKQINFGQEGN